MPDAIAIATNPALDRQIWDALDLPVPTVWAVSMRRQRHTLGAFVNGTGSAPHLLLHVDAIERMYRDPEGYSLGHIVETTVYHEGGHAYLEAGGLPTQCHDQDVEDLIETAAQHAWHTGDIRAMREMLDRALPKDGAQ